MKNSNIQNFEQFNNTKIQSFEKFKILKNSKN